MRDVVGIGCLHKGIDAVVHILLNGVVDRTFAVARTTTIVIDTQSSTTINELHTITHLVQLHIEHACLTQGVLDATNLCDLATNMEMDQLETVLHIVLLDVLECRQQFTRGQTKLAGISTTLFPLART